MAIGTTFTGAQNQPFYTVPTTTNVIIRAPWPNFSYAQPHTQAIHPTIYLAALGRTGKA